jgi:hypothetical protein
MEMSTTAAGQGVNKAHKTTKLKTIDNNFKIFYEVLARQLECC